MDNLEALLTAAGVGLNTNNIITSCIKYLKNADSYAKIFGYSINVAGIVIGGAQTIVAFTDGEYTTSDWINAVSTALSVAGIACVIIPGTQVLATPLGILSCIVGLSSNFFTYNGSPMLIHIKMPDGGNTYLYLA